jgi:putative peptidoglycan lipid II flippase
MAVLAVPITRLVYQRGAFDPAATDLVSEAMWVWALSLPANGASLLFSRTFFSLQKPWLTTALAVGNLALNAALAAALYDPLGVKGVVLGSVAGTVGMAVAQAVALRRELNGIEGGKIVSVTIRVLIATAALAGVSYGVWRGLDGLLGHSLVMQILSLGTAIAAGIAVYIVLVLAMRVEEARQIRRLIGGRLRRGADASAS